MPVYREPIQVSQKEKLRIVQEFLKREAINIVSDRTLTTLVQHGFDFRMVHVDLQPAFSPERQPVQHVGEIRVEHIGVGAEHSNEHVIEKEAGP